MTNMQTIMFTIMSALAGGLLVFVAMGWVWGRFLHRHGLLNPDSPQIEAAAYIPVVPADSEAGVPATAATQLLLLLVQAGVLQFTVENNVPRVLLNGTRDKELERAVMEVVAHLGQPLADIVVRGYDA